MSLRTRCATALQYFDDSAFYNLAAHQLTHLYFTNYLGNKTVNKLPFPSSELTLISPLWVPTIIWDK